MGGNEENAKNKKQHGRLVLIIIIIILLLLLIASVITGAVLYNNARKHVHSYVENVVAPTCTEAGYTVYACSCGDSYLGDSIAAKGHVTVLFNAVEPTCTTEGHSAYWQCTVCEKYFADEDGEKPVSFSEISVPKTAHTLVYTAADSSTCTTEGHKEYWQCFVCNFYFADSEGNSPIDLTELTVPQSSHRLVHTAAVAATCTAEGRAEYWRCADCGNYFADSKATSTVKITNLTVAKKAHSLTYTAAVAATCESDGHAEYYKCSVCGGYFTDRNGSYQTTLSALKTVGDHKLVKVAATAATCSEDGNTEYYYCTVCGKYFSDSLGATATTLTDVIVPSTGEHVYGEPVWLWSADLSSATATLTCLSCGEAQTLEAQVSLQTTYPTCEEQPDGTAVTCDGETVAAATLTYGGTEYTATQSKTLPYDLTFTLIDNDPIINYSLNGIDSTSGTGSALSFLHTSVGVFDWDADYILQAGTGGSISLTVSGITYKDTTLSVYLPEGEWAELYVTFNDGTNADYTYYPVKYSLTEVMLEDGKTSVSVISSGSLTKVAAALGERVHEYSAGDYIYVTYILTWDWAFDNGYIDYVGVMDVFSGDVEGAMWSSSFNSKSFTGGTSKKYYVVESCSDWTITLVAEFIETEDGSGGTGD